MSTEKGEWRNESFRDKKSNNRNSENRRNFNRDGEFKRNSFSGESRGEGRKPHRPRINRSSTFEEATSGNSNRRFNSRSEGFNSGDRRRNSGGFDKPRFNRDDRQGGFSKPRFNRDDRQGGFDKPRFNRDDRQGGFNKPRFNRDDRQGGFNKPRFNRDDRRGFDDDNRRSERYNDSFHRPVRRTEGYNPNAKYSKKKQIQYKEQNVDPNAPIRLNKYLANAGVCSRREADDFIAAGVVSVNGEIVTELGTKVKRSDAVKFHNQKIEIENKVYVLLNKPKDCVTTSDDPQQRLTVMDIVKGACPERIYPVGRLDRNTTGVLMLTNDGELASKLTHPKFLKKKIYHVFLDKNLTKADMDKIASGVELEDGEIYADAISYIAEDKRDQVGIEIHSGKNRIVRRIFESLGYKVIKLDRVFFAGLTKKGLRRGEWRFLTQKEVAFLRMGSFN